MNVMVQQDLNVVMHQQLNLGNVAKAVGFRNNFFFDDYEKEL